MVQLRRFTPTGGKLNDAVSYDRTFDISPYMAAGSSGGRYSLYAVVCHSGSGPHSGHYTSRVQSTDGKGWYVMDDSSVYPLAGGQAPLGLREAYLLMYIREKGGKADKADHAAAAATAPVANKPEKQQQTQVAAAGPMPSPAPSSPATSRQALAVAAAAVVGPSGNKKRRISEIPAEADRSLPSPPTTSDPDEDDEEPSSDDDDEEDVGRPAATASTSAPLLRLNAPLNAPLIARSSKKARRESLPTPSSSAAGSTASSTGSTSTPAVGAALPQGLGPRPFGFGAEKKDTAVPAAHNQKRRRDGSKKHGHHHQRGIKDPYGLSLAGKGGHKLKKGLVKRMGGRP